MSKKRFFKKICFFIIRSIFIIIGIISICGLPKLFLGVSQKPLTIQGMEPPPLLQFNMSQYVDSILNVISSLFNPTKITYKVSSNFQSPDLDLFPYLLDSYLHTLPIMIGAFLVASITKKESSQQARRFFSLYGMRRVQFLGNAPASRTFDNSRNLYTSLSSPIPNPPCGGQPYRNVSIYDWNFS